MSFTVDYDALASLAGTLGNLADGLAGLDDRMEGYGAAVGHDAMAEALEEAGGNWDDDREEIVETMRNAADYAMQAAGLYRETDEGVAAEVGGADGG